MTEKRWALDLFACEGGATRGLQRAGYKVVAVDTSWSRLARNPAEVRVCGDAVDYARRYSHLFDFRWASPPCQDYTAGTRATRAQGRSTGFARLIEATRAALLLASDEVPYAIENVAGARAELVNPVVLCGGDYALEADDDDETRLHLQRHRLIETNLTALPITRCEPFACRHDRPGRQVAGVYGGARKDKAEARLIRGGGYVPAPRRIREQLLGLEGAGMTLKGLEECVPPVYAEEVASWV